MKMGRGRNGITNQSMKKMDPRRGHKIAKFYEAPGESDETKIIFQEDDVEFIKKMNPQQLVDFLLLNDEDWRAKTSGIKSD